MESSDLDRRAARWARSPAGEARLATLLAELGGEERFARFAECLAVYERRDRARVAFADRALWHKRLSWRLVRAVVVFGVASSAGFVAWGGERAFEAALLFLCGGAAFYLLAQVAVALAGRGDLRALELALARADGELSALAERAPE